MSIAAKMITIDCRDPKAQATWWASALGGKIAEDYGEFVMVAAEPLFFGFQRVPEDKKMKNRVHVDFAAEDRRAEVDRLVELGAKVLGEHEVPGLAWTTLQDPEGNEFDVSG
jgi:predicted enzyme related to lactoylglutathione lyase